MMCFSDTSLGVTNYTEAAPFSSLHLLNKGALKVLAKILSQAGVLITVLRLTPHCAALHPLQKYTSLHH